MKQPNTYITLSRVVEPGKLVNAVLRSFMLLALFTFTVQSFASMSCIHATPSIPSDSVDMTGCHDMEEKLESWAEQQPDLVSAESECCDNTCPMSACYFGSAVVNDFGLPMYPIAPMKVHASDIEMPSARSQYIFRPPIFA